MGYIYFGTNVAEEVVCEFRATVPRGVRLGTVLEAALIAWVALEPGVRKGRLAARMQGQGPDPASKDRP